MNSVRPLFTFLFLAAVRGLAQTPAPRAPAALQGVVIADDRKALRREGWPRPDAFRVDATHAPEIPAEAAERVLDPFRGKPIDLPLLQDLRKALQQYFESVHQPFVSVTVPPQSIDSGVVQVLITVGRLGKITVTGNRWFGSGQYTGAIGLPPGGSIDSSVIDRGLDQINANSYRRATVVATPGSDVGTTDLQIRTQEDFPVTVQAGVDNTGNRGTGLTQLNAGFDWGNAFWRGDTLSGNVTTSTDPYRLKEYTVSYGAGLPWDNRLSVQGSYAQSRVASDAFIANTGLTRNLSVRDAIPLPLWGGIRQHVSVGYDYKSTNNNLLFGGISIFPSTSEIDQGVIAYDAALDDKLGSTRIGVTLTGSPGGLDSRNRDAAFGLQQVGAHARYAYGRLNAGRDVRLPKGWAWNTQASLQVSANSLLPSEQVVFGGNASVRGFMEQAATRDDGLLVENELSAPALSPGLPRRLGLTSAGDQLTVFAFLDYGTGWDHSERPGVPSHLALGGAGPGLRYQAGRNLTARLTYGIPVLTSGVPIPELRTQFAVELSW